MSVVSSEARQAARAVAAEAASHVIGIDLQRKVYAKTYQKSYMMAYEQSPTTRARRNSYNRSPDCKARLRAYYRRPEVKARRRGYQKAFYRDPLRMAQRVLRSSKSSDRACGRENNLTIEFIKRAVAGGCRYCGETEMVMTLDRVDNSKGHLTNNVVAACYRCNIVRRDMPYEAWCRFFVPAMREAREVGAFRDWAPCDGRHNRYLYPRQ